MVLWFEAVDGEPLYSKAICQEYNFTGKEGKAAFGQLKLWDAALGALLSVCEGEDLCSVQSFAGRWLSTNGYVRKDQEDKTSPSCKASRKDSSKKI
ncbi:hypothetical protein FOCC_FOCC017437 [Frankliniella occidentalis]|nr:hypothetical protein FOCC_FOCC017437 [Frankliniella occidentalis]